LVGERAEAQDAVEAGAAAGRLAQASSGGRSGQRRGPVSFSAVR